MAKDKEHRLFHCRVYNLKYRDRKRGYYREPKYFANMPVDLYMMRNEQKFNEGQRLEY